MRRRESPSQLTGRGEVTPGKYVTFFFCFNLLIMPEASHLAWTWLRKS